MTDYGMRKDTTAGFDEMLARLPEVLRSEGFGVLTEIDVTDTMKQKLGVEFRRYRILGACNPPLAHAALCADLNVGLMMPCNVVLWEDDRGKAVVSVVDPMATLAAQANPAVQEVATKVQAKLRRVLDLLG
jgi:uncharacterized protein (DUF302 family)